MNEIDFLRKLYLEDLSRLVNYGAGDRPRVRHVGNWERIHSTHERHTVKFPLASDDERDVWVWSDLHFNHKNIIGFSERPYDNVEQMNEHLVANHNDYVKEDDIVIWVGDVAFGTDESANEILGACNGYKILVVGNHDFNRRKLRKLDFDEIHLLSHIEVEPGFDLVFTHYPMFNLPDYYFNVHGHIHAGANSDGPQNSPQHINVNCEFHEYKPLNLNKLIEMLRLRQI